MDKLLDECVSLQSKELDPLSFVRASMFLLEIYTFCQRPDEKQQLLQNIYDNRRKADEDSARAELVDLLANHGRFKQAYSVAKSIDDLDLKTTALCRLALFCNMANKPWLANRRPVSPIRKFPWIN